MTRGVLDTSILIDLPRIPEEHLPEEAAVSVASLAELHFGVQMARSPADRLERLRLLQQIESTCQALPVDSDTARIYGSLAFALRKSGRNPRARVMDLLIAATARAHNIPLFTRNARDFTGLDDFVEIRTV